MGTRRLRDLHQHPDVTLALFDERADRRERAHSRFGVRVFERMEDALAWGPEAFVISTPPGTKDAYVESALKNGLHHFIEADIWVRGAAEIDRISKAKKLVSAPSSALGFLPVVKALGRHVRDDLGTFLSYQASMATYMPGWHASEGLEYYARHRSTTAGREMVPFELHWLSTYFGAATEVAGRFEKYGNLPYPFEDTWSLSMRLAHGGVGQLIISMASPVGFRRGSCFGTNAVIAWDIYNGDLSIQTTADKQPRVTNYGSTEQVLEPMYTEEIGTFIDATLGRKAWPQSYPATQRSSATLAAAEKSFVTQKWERVDPALNPESSPPTRG